MAHLSFHFGLVCHGVKVNNIASGRILRLEATASMHTSTGLSWSSRLKAQMQQETYQDTVGPLCCRLFNTDCADKLQVLDI